MSTDTPTVFGVVHTHTHTHNFHLQRDTNRASVARSSSSVVTSRPCIKERHLANIADQSASYTCFGCQHINHSVNDSNSATNKKKNGLPSRRRDLFRPLDVHAVGGPVRRHRRRTFSSSASSTQSTHQRIENDVVSRTGVYGIQGNPLRTSTCRHAQVPSKVSFIPFLHLSFHQWKMVSFLRHPSSTFTI